MKAWTYLILLVTLVAGCKGADRSYPVEGAASSLAAPGAEGSLEDSLEEFLIIERGYLTAQAKPLDSEDPLGGELRAVVRDPNGEERQIPLPLKHTDVKARVTLHVGSVKVTQQYENPFDSKIEAVYLFPLPQNAAVSDFVMRIGERRIRGIIREREEAERIYAEARRQGYVASLLTQERPNVFTQKVANIEPGKALDIEIDYFQTLRYEQGEYEFVFPMVVGPRFNPPGTSDGIGAVGRGAQGTSGQRSEVSYLRPGEVSSHLISLRVDLDAGLAMHGIESPSHSIEIERQGETRATVTLAEADRIPNKDFVLRYRVADEQVHGTLVTQRDAAGGGGYFTLMLQPPRTLADVPDQPREMVFVVDCSGSMRGEPLAICKRAMRRCLKRLSRDDTFNVIRFSESASSLGAKPVPATPANVRKGLRYVDALDAGGGTMMIRGIRAALRNTGSGPERRRIVSFMTDGYIGNEGEILAEIHANIDQTRIFSFGIGSSVNRYLLERMASEGRGVSTYVGLDESSERAVDALYQRVEQPALTDLSIDWAGITVRDAYPAPLPDLFVGRPVIVSGRFEGGGTHTVQVHGKRGGEPTTIRIPVDFDAPGANHAALGRVWARTKIAHLKDGLTRSADPDEMRQAITDLALRHNLVSDFTAFVAVDSTRVTEGDHGTTVPVAVPVPEGTRYETAVGGN